MAKPCQSALAETLHEGKTERERERERGRERKREKGREIESEHGEREEAAGRGVKKLHQYKPQVVRVSVRPSELI